MQKTMKEYTFQDEMGEKVVVQAFNASEAWETISNDFGMNVTDMQENMGIKIVGMEKIRSLK